jgi:hypothetical protein
MATIGPSLRTTPATSTGPTQPDINNSLIQGILAWLIKRRIGPGECLESAPNSMRFLAQGAR